MMISFTQKKKIGNALTYVLLIFLAVIFIFPMIAVVTNSLKPDLQIQYDMTSIKSFIPYGSISLNNYKGIFEKFNFAQYFFNSAFSTAAVVIFGTIISAMMGYALGMLEFKGKNALITATIAMIIIPGEAVCMNQMLLITNLGMINTMWALILPFLTSPLFIFLYYQHFLGMPRELMQAAVIDGSNYFMMFWQIMLPLSKPVTATVAVLSFIGRWNDLLWPVLVTRDDTIKTLPMAMQMLYADFYTYWGEIFAFAVLMTLPVLLIFIIFQKQFVQSLAMTGIKG